MNYQSLRWVKTWDSEACHVACFEIPGPSLPAALPPVTIAQNPGCDHRGVSKDPRVMKLLRGVLDLGQDAYADQFQEEASTSPSSTCTRTRAMGRNSRGPI